MLATPALSLLRKNFPKANIAILSLKRTKCVILGNSNVDKIFTYDHDASTRLFEVFWLIFKLRKEKFDLSICLYPSGLRSAFVGFLSGARIRVGQKLIFFKKFPFLFTIKVNVSQVKHAIDMNLDLLKALKLNVEDEPKTLFMPISNSDEKSVSEFKEKNNIKNKDLLIAIHPGVSEGGMHRCWPKQNFIELINKLAGMFNAKILLIGGPSEVNLIEEIYNLAKEKPIKVINLSLNAVAALLKDSSLFIGNNSGPMHIASSVKTPTVAIFGDTDPRIHAPYGNRNIVVRKKLFCSPCHYPFLHGTISCAKKGRGFVKGRFVCATNDFKCMKEITVSDVLLAVEALLHNIKKV